jgi:hypothetical protein
LREWWKIAWWSASARSANEGPAELLAFGDAVGMEAWG